MENKKTIEHLNGKAWYRALKVIYIFSFIAVFASITLVFWLDPVLDIPNSKIICQYGNGKQFLIKEVFSRDEMPDTLPLPTYSSFSGGRHLVVEKEERKILDACEIGEDTPPKTIPFGTDLSVPLSPYGIERKDTPLFGYLFLSLFIAAAVFEAIRRVFYYVVLGKINPEK